MEEFRRVGHLKLIRLRDRGRGRKEEGGKVKMNGRINEANNWICSLFSSSNPHLVDFNLRLEDADSDMRKIARLAKDWDVI